MNSSKPKVGVLVAVPLAMLVACAGGPYAQETTGERFRRVLAQIDEECKRDKMGPYLDPNDPEYRNKRRGTDCDILKLEPRDWRTEKLVKTEGQHHPIPERWLTTPEGRFAHSIRLPAPHDKSKVIYRSGMGTKDYFDALCRAEAGDFVFRTVRGVESVLRARPPQIETDSLLSHLFAPEAPVGAPLWQSSSGIDEIGQVFVQPDHGKYRFVEIRTAVGASNQRQSSYRRYLRDPARATGKATNYRADGGTYPVPNEVVEIDIESPASKYEFIWRGIVRPNDRELGIAGGELIVLARETKEVLGLRRVFRATTGVGRRGVWWLTAANCSKELATLPGTFIYRVLVPMSATMGEKQ